MMVVTLVGAGSLANFVVATIDTASTGKAKFAANGGQSIIVLNDSASDTDGTATVAKLDTITIALRGTGEPGVVLVNLTQGVTGTVGTADSTPIQVRTRRRGRWPPCRSSTRRPALPRRRALARYRRF